MNGYQKSELENIMEWQKGSKLHKNRMVWTQIFKDTEASEGTNTI